MNEQTPFLSVEAAAQFLNLSPKTLNTWRSRRSDGPPFRRFGSRVVYGRTDLEKWADARSLTHTGAIAQAAQ